MAQLVLLTLILIFTINLQLEAKEWLSNANYYQIYPRSYKDTTGTGVGDLQGIKQKVPYLKSLGIDGVWLSPIMKSPMVDHGYDISDFRDIHWEFGTMQDFDELLAECNKNGLKLILDFVPNHTSNKHIWFEKSAAGDPEYADYYIWHPGRPNPAGGRPLPPNNWLSCFRFSAWEWNSDRQQYYYHAFTKEQPDLNYRNPKVVKEMKDVLRFWLDKGVGGFRCDTVPHMFEILPDDNGNLLDEPLTGECEPGDYCYLEHIYTQSLPEMYDMIYQWRELLEEYSEPFPRVLLTEAYVTLDRIMQYYNNGSGRNGSHIPFNFELLAKINRASNGRQIRSIVENYMNHIPKGYEPNWVLGNHDNHRIPGRLGEERAELFNFLLQTLPGNAITYQGEEIVMPNVNLTWEATQDPQACVTNETIYFQNSRDPARTPMQWDDSVSAGFSTNPNTWLPVGESYKTVNVAVQEIHHPSPLKNFRELTSLRKEGPFQYGLYESAKHVDDDLYVYARSRDKEVYIIALNFGDSPKSCNLSANFINVPSQVRVVIASVTSGIEEG